MTIMNPIVGKTVVLRSVAETDAEFTLKIRNDPQLTTYIPKVNGSLEQQLSWIKIQREKKDDYFFIIEGKNEKKLGTVAYYDLNLTTKRCELGRYISYGNPLNNVEAVILLLDFLFFKQDFETIILNNDQRNEKVINFWKKFGASFNAYYNMDGWIAAQYLLHKEAYCSKREKISMLLARKET